MLNWTKTQFVWSVPEPVMIASVSTIQEGMALVAGYENGTVKAQPATGATSGFFKGVAMSPRRTFGVTNASTTVTAPVGGGTVLLPNTVTGTIGAVIATTGAQLTVSTSAASSTNVQSSTDSTTGLTALTFDSTHGGVTFSIFYSYAMAALVEQALYGNPYPGFAPSDTLQQVGVIKLGKVSTSCYSPTANWYLSAGTNLPQVCVGANGLFTSSDATGAAFLVPNVEIITIPSPSYPWLDILIH